MILSFGKYTELNEGFKNFIGKDSISDREKIVDRVWDILQSSYAKIGGIHGSGFKTKEDMIENIPFWKVYETNGKVLVVAMYKDKGGRKAVAYVTDGSMQAKKILSDVFKSELKISWGEKSKGALVMMMKSAPFEVIEPYLITPSEVSHIIHDNTVIVPTQEYVNDNLDKADQAVYNRLKILRNYFYVRIIGGQPHLKVAMGSVDQHII